MELDRYKKLMVPYGAREKGKPVLRNYACQEYNSDNRQFKYRSYNTIGKVVPTGCTLCAGNELKVGKF